MAKLTRAQRKEIQDARDRLKWAIDYLTSPEVAGIAHHIRKLEYANGGDYLRINQEADDDVIGGPKGIILVNHRIGSPIAGVYSTLRMLDEFLANNQ